MSKAKKLLAMMVALVMAMTMMIGTGMTVLAATVTIPEEMKDHTFVAYQIFKGTYSGEHLVDIQWTTEGFNQAKFIEELKKSNISALGNFDNDADAATIAELLAKVTVEADKEKIAKAALAGITENSQKYMLNEESTNLADGYYLVVDETASLSGKTVKANNAALLQVVGNLTIQKKTDAPTVVKKVAENTKYTSDGGFGEKYNDVADYNIGDAVPFELIGSIPDMSKFETYHYEFVDHLDKGLSVDADEKDIHVFLSNDKKVDLTNDYELKNDDTDIKYDLTVGNYDVAKGQDLSIKFKDLKKTLADLELSNLGEYKYIIVQYHATLNEDAEIGLPGNVNEVYLKYSRKPDQSGEGEDHPTEDSEKDFVIVFTYELDTTKVDKNNSATTLKDAEFKLQNAANKYAQIDANQKVTGWVEKVEDASILKSGTDGKFAVIGLDDGDYTLIETKAPEGYNMPKDGFKVTITATTTNGQNWTAKDAAAALTALKVQVGNSEAKDGDRNKGTVDVTIENSKGSFLPETGGIGTTLFYVIGAILAIGAGVTLVTRKRMNNH